MKLSVFSPVLGAMTLEESLKYLKGLGVSALELGCGGYPGIKHADAKELVKDKKKITVLKDLFEKYEMEISAISVHGNPVHPNASVATGFQNDFDAACKLAGILNVERIVTFSGCPGDKTSTYPNWVTCPWPEDFTKVLDYQWNEVLIPYWGKAVKNAEDSGVKKICLEMHPGFCVYNPETLLKLRKAVGNMVGANFDPSHLFWQGINPIDAIKFLGDSIYFFHAKDTSINIANTRINGVLDTKHYGDELNRSWIFRTVGYGHNSLDWKEIISMLRLVGYDAAISIEHEDSLMTPKEGLEKAVKFLQDIMIFQTQKDGMWWA